MAIRFSCWLISLTFVGVLNTSGCAGDSFDTSQTGGDTSKGGTSATGGGSGSAGVTSGGTRPSYPDPKRECTDTDQCVAVVDTSDPCYSASCSHPIAASKTDRANNPCLVLWHNRSATVKDECKTAEAVVCTAGCAQQPACIETACSSNLCELALIYDANECKDCSELATELGDALSEARKCESSSTTRQCTGQTDVKDKCDCPVAVNANAKEAIEDAIASHQAWSDAGCKETIRCSPCASPTEAVPICDPMTSTCI